MTIYSFYQITKDYFEIKFQTILDTQSITNNKFILYKIDAGTPNIITSAFKTIDINRDYYSISRSLYLWWNIQLESNSSYRLVISNLVNVEGATPEQTVIDFDTLTIDYGLPAELEPATRQPVDVEDYSIKTISELISSSIASGDVEKLLVIKTVPEMNKAYYLDPSENEGRIEIWFNQAPAANYVNDIYFKIQRRKVTRNISRWEDVNAKVAANTAKAVVFIYLPSLDATPVYAYEINKGNGNQYFEPGYKYRVLLSKDIGI
jgi:hypothetical protein